MVHGPEQRAVSCDQLTAHKLLADSMLAQLSSFKCDRI